jgi:very-short-patch-repair endonuclease
MARRQHGIVTRRALLGLGFSGEAIDHRIEKGRLHPVMRGVYAVGWPATTREQRWMAAVLAAGDRAVLSHGSAAALWGIGGEGRGQIDVTLRRSGKRNRPELRVRTRPALPDRDVTVHRGIPTTTPVRTLVDMASEVGWSAVERAVNDADKRDLVDPETLRAALGDYRGVPGVRLLRAVIDKHTFRLSDSELEVRFRPLARAAGLPPPLTKQMVNGFEVDFHWPELGLIVETDGLTYHRTGISQSRDRLRDQTHTAAGLTTLRFSHYQVRHEPAHVRAVLRKVASLKAAGQRVGL